jgi:hypothetical protein
MDGAGLSMSAGDDAGALQMLDRHTEAVAIYQRLIRRGPIRIADDPCGEGLARSRGLIADCHLRLSDSLHELGDAAGAARNFMKHLDLRGPGCQSIYPLKEIAARRRRNGAKLGANDGSLKSTGAEH